MCLVFSLDSFDSLENADTNVYAIQFVVEIFHHIHIDRFFRRYEIVNVCSGHRIE